MYKTQNITLAIKTAQTADVATPKDSAVVYSISFQPNAENREKAFAFVRQNPGKMLIEHTECGAKLVELGFEGSKTLNQEEAVMIWSVASRRFINAASGNLTAFVEGADPRSVFLTIELPNILSNPNIMTVNGVDKFEFAKRFEK